ncbi:hypothetical protein CBL_00978 [Carabus blaptoides fortunei]
MDKFRLFNAFNVGEWSGRLRASTKWHEWILDHCHCAFFIDLRATTERVRQELHMCDTLSIATIPAVTHEKCNTGTMRCTISPSRARSYVLREAIPFPETVLQGAAKKPLDFINFTHTLEINKAPGRSARDISVKADYSTNVEHQQLETMQHQVYAVADAILFMMRYCLPTAIPEELHLCISQYNSMCYSVNINTLPAGVSLNIHILNTGPQQHSNLHSVNIWTHGAGLKYLPRPEGCEAFSAEIGFLLYQPGNPSTACSL